MVEEICVVFKETFGLSETCFLEYGDCSVLILMIGRIQHRLRYGSLSGRIDGK